MIILNAFLVRAFRDAPNIDFEIFSAATGQLEALQNNDIDLAVDSFIDAPPQFYRSSMLENHLVCLVRPDHPAIEEGFDQAAFSRWPHVWIDTATSRALDRFLSEKGIERRCLVRITGFLTGASIVANSDCIMVLPNIAAQKANDLSAFVALPLPFDTERLTLDLLWHPRSHNNPAHIWLRDRIKATAVEINSQGK